MLYNKNTLQKKVYYSNTDATPTIQLFDPGTTKPRLLAGYGGLISSKTAWGMGNPKRSKQIRNNENATTPRLLEAINYIHVPSHFVKNAYLVSNPNVKGPLGTKDLMPYISSFTPYYTGSLTNARAEAFSVVHSKIYNAHHTASGMVVLAELKRTIELLRSPFMALQGLTKRYFDNVAYSSIKANVRGINQNKRSDVVKDVLSQTWLEFQFGAKPLIRDIHDISLAILEIRLKLDKTKVRAKTEVDVTTSTEVLEGWHNGFYITNYKITGVRYGCYTRLELLPVLAEDFAIKTLGFDLSSLAMTAWEAFPWSFLWDYFLNIQEIINAAFNVQEELVGVSQSEVITKYQYDTWQCLDWKRDDTAAGYKSTSLVYNTPGSLARSSVQIERKSSLGFPPLVASWPGFTQGLNIAALIGAKNRVGFALIG